EGGEGEAVVHGPRRGARGRLEEAAGADLLLHEHARGVAGRVGEDVERAADGGHGEVDGGQPALKLDGGRHVTDAVPVRPVDPAVLHVVDGDAVDHHGRVALVEPTYVDAGVGGAAAALGGIDARRHV